MIPQSRHTDRDEAIRHLAHRLLIEQGWPDSGNFDDYYMVAGAIYDAQVEDTIGTPIREQLLKQKPLASRRF